MATKRWQDGLYWESEPSSFTFPSLLRFLRSTRWPTIGHKLFFSYFFSGSQFINAVVGAPRDGGRSFQSFLQLTFAHGLILISSGLISFRDSKGSVPHLLTGWYIAQEESRIRWRLACRKVKNMRAPLSNSAGMTSRVTTADIYW